VRDFKHEAKDELYDLLNDPAETRNLIDWPDATIQNTRESLNRKLLERMREIDDPALKLQPSLWTKSIEPGAKDGQH
jgi:hypothetical protein